MSVPRLWHFIKAKHEWKRLPLCCHRSVVPFLVLTCSCACAVVLLVDPQRAPREGVDAAAGEELGLVLEELNHHTVISALLDGLHKGGPSGPIGSFDFSGLSVQGIDAGIATADKLGCPTVTSKQLYATSKLVRKLRVAIMEGRWGSVEDLISTVRVVSGGVEPSAAALASSIGAANVSYNVHECVQAELRRCDVEVVNRNVDARLRSALLVSDHGVAHARLCQL